MTSKDAFRKLMFEYYLTDEEGKGEHDELVEQVSKDLELLEKLKKDIEYSVATKETKQKFKVWLVKNNLSMRQFANKCGCSVQYISLVINAKAHITYKTRAIFQKGGYKTL